MKNSKKMFILTEIVLAGMVMIVAFAMFQEKIGEERGKVSVIIQNSDDKHWDAFKYGLRMAAQDYQIEVFVVSTGGSFSAEEEKEAIEHEIDNGADAVIIQPVMGADTQSMLRKIESKVPIMLVESLVTEDEWVTEFPAVKPNNSDMGKALAEELLMDYNGKLEGKTVGIVSGRRERLPSGGRDFSRLLRRRAFGFSGQSLVYLQKMRSIFWKSRTRWIL